MNHLARTAGRAKSVVAQPLIAASLAASSLSRLFSSTSLHQNSSTSVDELIQQRSNEDASTAAELRKEVRLTCFPWGLQNEQGVSCAPCMVS
jgi:hypothetical protein